MISNFANRRKMKGERDVQIRMNFWRLHFTFRNLLDFWEGDTCCIVACAQD